MLWKLIFVAVLAVGVSGRSIDDRESELDRSFDQVARVYCKATDAENKTQEVKESIMTYAECIKGLFDVNAVKTEFEEAMRTNVFDQFFKNQCTKVPQFKTCVHSLIIGMSPCLPASINSTGTKFVGTILDFACENDGARLTSFFKNDGPQCMRQQRSAIMACSESMKANITKLVGENGPTATFKMADEEKCSLADTIVDCLVAALKLCPNPTPGNLIEELNKKIPCPKVVRNTEDPPAAEQTQ